MISEHNGLTTLLTTLLFALRVPIKKRGLGKGHVIAAQQPRSQRLAAQVAGCLPIRSGLTTSHDLI